MKHKHSYKKPRYKICFQTKNKTWIYKNSRLRNFYKIRNNRVLNNNQSFYKSFLSLQNMKWWVARRRMVPYFRKQNRMRYGYKNLFFKKQQLKLFYGGLKEYEIRTLFKRTWNKEQNFRTNIFIGSLEQRISVILYRLRVLPTIFSCNQLIKHHGIFVNNTKVLAINYRVKIADMVIFPIHLWILFFIDFIKRLEYRLIGLLRLENRKYFFTKKLHFVYIVKKTPIKANFRFLKRAKRQIQKIQSIKNCLLIIFNSFFKSFTNIPIKNQLLYDYLTYLLPELEEQYQEISSYFFMLTQWIKPDYFINVNHFIFTGYTLKIKIFALVQFFCDWIIQGFSVRYPELNKWRIKEESLINIQIFKEYKIWGYKVLKITARKGMKIFNKMRTKDIYFRRFLMYIFKQLKIRFIKKKKTFLSWYPTPHWYLPKHLEFDFCTLRTFILANPSLNEVHFSFEGSLQKIISFYKQRAV